MDLHPAHFQQQQHQQQQHLSQSPNYSYSYNQTPSPLSPPGAVDHQQRDINSNPATNSSHRSRYDDDIANNNNYHLSLAVPQPQNSHQVGRFTEEWNASQRSSLMMADGQQAPGTNMQRTPSVHSFNAGDDQQLPSRGNTLKKKNSLRRNGSLKRSNSRRSMRAGSVKSLALQSTSDPDEAHSAFHCPVPTSGNPTEVLSNRFQSWRKILKDLIAYFREIQSQYEHRSKTLLKLSNVSNNIATPSGFLSTAGIDDALQFIRSYNKNAVIEANKAKEIEDDVILALTGLRSDLQQKIKEIKNLSGDFKNTVAKEMDGTRKAVRNLGDVLGKNEMDESLTTGKQDPYLLRLAVDRQVERQVDEENYLHQAYLNLENSGRELESIVVGEIQKAYNAYAGILKREADNAYGVIEELREGPISMPKDQEWIHFVTNDSQFVDPNIPIRSADQIHYPGQDHESAQEIRAGLLERKSKYLKSYTAGWYVLSATHLHEFKSADKAQAPVMSLYLPEQKLGSHSAEGGSSNKFILKGRQTGGMHRGHSWVFRAESHDTMMAWYEDIKALTEKTAEERSQFVRSHGRSLSRSSRRSVSSDGLLDEDDEEPFAAESQVYANPGSKSHDTTPRRSQAGGRFPSDIQVNAQRGLQASHSPSSINSSPQDQRPDPAITAVSGALPAAAVVSGAIYGAHHMGYGGTEQTPMDAMHSNAAIASQKAQHDGVNPYTNEPIQQQQQTSTQDYFMMPVVLPEPPNQQPFPDQYDNQRRDEMNREAPPDTQNEGRFDDAIAAENRKLYGDDRTDSTLQDRSENGVVLDGEAFPKLGDIANKSGIPRSMAMVAPEGESLTNDLDDEDHTPVRPTSHNARTESVMTISNLHIPGGYPHGAPV
ncbi:hypothetical protein BGZ63DRAFT_376332 [Mariannaea sp. PMI_226]|nr:hypothetical protein BGZ63DRAFT_376332 [Mariannaea sp. PMI_226]